MKMVVKGSFTNQSAYCFNCREQSINECRTQCIKDRTKKQWGKKHMKFVVKPAAYFTTAYCYGCVDQCHNVCGEQCIKDRTK